MSINPQIIMTPERLVGLAYSLVLSVNRRTLRPLQRTLESNPSINEEMSRSGGFRNIIESITLTPRAQSSLDRLCQVQDTILTSDRFRNTAVGLPTIQEETENLNEINGIIVGIKTHLNDCCDEIKSQLKEIKNICNNILVAIKDLNTEIFRFYASEKRKLISFLADLKLELRNLIREVITEELNDVKEKLNIINDTIDTIHEHQIPSVNDNVSSVDHLITDKFTGLDHKIGLIDELLGTLNGTLDGYITAWGAWCDFYDLVLKSGFGAITLSISGIEGTIASKIIIDKITVTRELKASESKTRNFIKNKIDKQTKFLKDEKRGLPFILTNEICYNIVGESY